MCPQHASERNAKFAGHMDCASVAPCMALFCGPALPGDGRKQKHSTMFVLPRTALSERLSHRTLSDRTVASDRNERGFHCKARTSTGLFVVLNITISNNNFDKKIKFSVWFLLQLERQSVNRL